MPRACAATNTSTYPAVSTKYAREYSHDDRNTDEEQTADHERFPLESPLLPAPPKKTLRAISDSGKSVFPKVENGGLQARRLIP
jgi:hypothetical protein